MKLRGERGEVASWLMVAIALALAAALAGGMLSSTATELTNDGVEPAAMVSPAFD